MIFYAQSNTVLSHMVFWAQSNRVLSHVIYAQSNRVLSHMIPLSSLRAQHVFFCSTIRRIFVYFLFLQVSSTNRSVPKRQQTLTLDVLQGIYQNVFHSEVTNSWTTGSRRVWWKKKNGGLVFWILFFLQKSVIFGWMQAIFSSIRNQKQN